MGQQSLIYSFVARGTVILAEYTEFTGNFTSIASQCLQKLPATNNKFTYNCDGHTFNYLVEDGFSEFSLKSFLICLLIRYLRDPTVNPCFHFITVVTEVFLRLSYFISGLIWLFFCVRV